MNWSDIDNWPMTAQRRALYRFGIKWKLVQSMMAAEAATMLAILCAIAQRAAVAPEVDHD